MPDTLDLGRLEKLLAEATPGPWHLCQHLKSLECDQACSCGYRGVIYGPEHDVAMAICQPGHEPAPRGQEGTEPGRYPRAIEIANMHLLVAAVNALPYLLSRISELESALRPPEAVLTVMRRMDLGYGFPARDVAIDTEIPESTVKFIYRALEAMGWAKRHPFYDEDEPVIRGSGYSLTEKGLQARNVLGERA